MSLSTTNNGYQGPPTFQSRVVGPNGMTQRLRVLACTWGEKKHRIRILNERRYVVSYTAATTKKNCDKNVPSQCPYVLPKLRKNLSTFFVSLLQMFGVWVTPTTREDQCRTIIRADWRDTALWQVLLTTKDGWHPKFQRPDVSKHLHTLLYLASTSN